MSRTGWSSLVFVAVTLGSVVAGAVEPARWTEPAFGVSLTPPAGARLVENSRDEVRLRMELPSDDTISFSIRKATAPMTIDQVVDRAVHLMEWSHPRAVLFERKVDPIAGRRGVRLYFRVPDEKTGPWVLAQALVMIDPQTVAVLHMDVDLPRFDEARPVFDAVVGSLALADPKQLERERSAAIDRAEAWLSRLNARHWSAALVPERWLRIVENDLDVGYMRVQQYRDLEMNLPGIRIDVQVRMMTAGKATDTLGNIFLADDGKTEFWSVRTTVRDPASSGPAGAAIGAARPRGLMRRFEEPPAPSWAETGLRSEHEITVTVQTPSGKTERRWDKPPRGYLPHALQHLMGQLLPRQPISMVFYSYHPNDTALVLRSERVELSEAGGYRVISRAAPDEPEQVAEYDATGRLLRVHLADGRLLLPSTLNQIQTIWRLR